MKKPSKRTNYHDNKRMSNMRRFDMQGAFEYLRPQSNPENLYGCDDQEVMT